jgi:hypothetical protein
MDRRTTTYSFKDLTGIIAHPYATPFKFVGAGIGQIDLAMSTERTTHDVAADGCVMVSKIEAHNGTVKISCQQTSDLHKYLLGLYNYLDTAVASQWALITIALRNIATGTSHFLNGVSFSKKADYPYRGQGQMVEWTLMVADMQDQPF